MNQLKILDFLQQNRMSGADPAKPLKQTMPNRKFFAGVYSDSCARQQLRKETDG